MPTKPKILVADDDKISRTLLSMLLEDDFDVHTAEDGAECLQQINDFHPDVLILDVNMPGLDGDDVCYNLKQSTETEHIPIIFVTALSEDAYKTTYGEIRADGFISKPIDEVVLTQTIEEVLAKRQ